MEFTLNGRVFLVGHPFSFWYVARWFVVFVIFDISSGVYFIEVHKETIVSVETEERIGVALSLGWCGCFDTEV